MGFSAAKKLSPPDTWPELKAAQPPPRSPICRRRPDVSLLLLLLGAVEFIAADVVMLQKIRGKKQKHKIAQTIPGRYSHHSRLHLCLFLGGEGGVGRGAGGLFLFFFFQNLARLLSEAGFKARQMNL